MAGTLTVACKIPTGLIIQAYTSEEWDEPVMGGGTRRAKRAIKKGDPIKLNGPAKFFNKAPLHDIRNGVGLTYGVDADTFNEWIKQNADSDFVKKGMVFANAKTPEVDAQAKDRRGEKSGLERMNPKDLPPEFKRKITSVEDASA